MKYISWEQFTNEKYFNLLKCITFAKSSVISQIKHGILAAGQCPPPLGNFKKSSLNRLTTIFSKLRSAIFKKIKRKMKKWWKSLFAFKTIYTVWEVWFLKVEGSDGSKIHINYTSIWTKSNQRCVDLVHGMNFVCKLTLVYVEYSTLVKINILKELCTNSRRAYWWKK